MAITFGQLRDHALRFIGNPEGEGLETGLILDAVRSAHDAIMPWAPKLKQTSFTGDGLLKAFPLPGDFYSVEAVVLNATGEVLPLAVFTPYQYYGANIADVNNWILSPSGYMTFSKIPSTGQIIDLYYCATWLKPDATATEDFLLEPPGYLETAMAYYTASQLIMPDALAQAGIGTYKTRVDSGNPEHSPLEKAITFLLNLFNQEMNRHPRHQRAQT